MDHVIHHLSRFLLQSHGSTNEVHVYALQKNWRTEELDYKPLSYDHFSSVFTEDDQSPLPDISNEPVLTSHKYQLK